MQTNALPAYDDTDNLTGCCPRFKPHCWDNQHLHFEDKRFLRAVTHSAMHIPIDMGRVFSRVNTHIEDQDAYDPDDFIVLSRDTSAWNSEHLFSVSKPVAGEEMTTLSGDFITRVFEGAYRKARVWQSEMQKAVEKTGKTPGQVWFFYTTCPRCAKTYGKNYVIGVAEVEDA
ncbi:hydrolase [Sulfitobacter sabulilitoris]|uniref:Uncharacterized protein n=1 Tax=Sulfitobacter sabulilitoris TaxID=2562655 RepID=A0A5S3PF73_9RHOB|nr:hydrolase [Sulfitobacter sabulilitoris]TMM52687.1 hypothetical protein FDT80_10490 [Sulfitobacter sabulilitoris]